MSPPAITATLTPEALILRLRSTEHDFVERKSRGDKGGWLQAAVAFANSAPIGWPAVLFVGVDDDGNPQQGAEKMEDLAKSISDTLDRAYPAIYRHVVPLHSENGACLAVIVPGSEARPHFAGKSYVRDGPQTIEASEEQFQVLIAQRLSKVRELLKWKGKEVTIEEVSSSSKHMTTASGRTEIITQSRSPHTFTLTDCNQFYVTVSRPNRTVSFTIAEIELSFDHPNNRLKLERRI
jgi:predicted HTH transcriptional regulator